MSYYGMLPGLENCKQTTIQKTRKSKNDGCLNISCPLSLPHWFNVTTLKINLAPFLHEDALCDSVMRNYTLINFGYLRD